MPRVPRAWHRANHRGITNRRKNKPMAKNTKLILQKIGDDSVPLAHRAAVLIDLLAEAQGGDNQSQALTHELFNRIENSMCDEVAKTRSKELKEILAQIELAPLRPATFLQMSAVGGEGTVPHALITLDNGELAYVVAHDQAETCKFQLGQRVMLDCHSKVLVRPAGEVLLSGVEARLERKIDDRHIEVTTHQDEKVVVLTGPDIIKQIDAGNLTAGASVILGSHGRLAIHATPPVNEEMRQFRFLDRGAIPDIDVERDIGAPPRVIAEVARHIREEMTRPELRRRFRLRPCITRLLCGVSGSGKTLAVQAIYRLMYQIMSEITGIPMEKLPHRVFRFRPSQVLSMWLGESDKNADKLFDEVEQSAAQTYHTADGKDILLPVLVIMEEADGMGQARGGEAIYDRILTTILQRLDPNRHGLANRLVVFLSTTNEPHMVDAAFLRRIGGSIEVFGRLSEEGFTDVLKKHIDGLPASHDGHSQKKAWQAIISDINQWLFLPGGDSGVVELTYEGYPRPVVKYSRDFLTGALVDRAVQQAATMAWEVSLASKEETGVTRDQLMGAINAQVQGVVGQLDVRNVTRYLDIPEGVRVGNVRRLSNKVRQ